MSAAVEGSLGDILHHCVASLFDETPGKQDFDVLMQTGFGQSRGGEHAWTVKSPSQAEQDRSKSFQEPVGEVTVVTGDEQEPNLSDDDSSPKSGRRRSASPSRAPSTSAPPRRPAETAEEDLTLLSVSPANATSVLAAGRSPATSAPSDLRRAAASSSDTKAVAGIPGPGEAGRRGSPADSARQAKAEGLLGSLRAEKSRLKRHLRALDEDFERTHGRKPTRAEKEHLRPQYERYRTLKRRIDAFAASPASASPPAAGGRDEAESAAAAPAPAPGNELADLKAQKRELQVQLRSFEEEFRRTHGRAVQFHRDIRPVERNYRRYKELKKRIASVEASARA